VTAPNTLSRAPGRAASVVVPGNHDGVHRGHRALLDLARRVSRPGEAVVALTFSPHPLSLLRPEAAPRPITTISRRSELLLAAGADRVHVAHFDAAYAAQEPRQWVEERLLRELGARAVVIGPDYRFGRGRGGTPELLAELGLEVDLAEAVHDDGEPVSSTRVRRALESGDVAGAARLLGRAHDLEGVVVAGQRRGRTIGFPTANLDALEGLVPADGVYAVFGRIGSDPRRIPGVANLGVRPTLGAGRSVEVHFFDLERDLYAERLRLGFVARLRGEQKFDSLDALVAHIRLDAAQARALLASADPALLL
jgi:riboflavin kinase/FMN adenylyltransferase